MSCRLTLLLALILPLPGCSESSPPSAPPGPPAAPPAHDITGHWEGVIQTPAAALGIRMDLARDGDDWTGTIDIPMQGAAGLPLKSIRINGEQIRFAITGVPGDPTFRGKIEKAKITGTFTQAGQTMPFELGREPVAAAARPKRPQEPKPPFPYKAEDVTYPSGDIQLAATLTLPDGPGPHPAVVLITGSGPQNRDEELMGHKPFLVLADHLTRAGVAVLRADDRGVGQSTGNFATATTRDFADDALAGVAFLKARNDIATDRIGLIGHSEGGIAAPLAATQSDDVAFIILLAGSGVPGIEVSQSQVAYTLRSTGLSDERIQWQLAFNRALLELLQTHTDADAISREARRVAQEHLAKASETVRAEVGTAEQLLDSVKTVMPRPSPWLRFFLSHDPAPVLARVKVPVLAIVGELDTQVDPDLNMPAIEAALADNADATTTRLPGLNHLFQKATTGSVAEYARIEETMNPAALELIAKWINQRFGE